VSLLAKAVYQSKPMLDVPASSLASQLPQGLVLAMAFSGWHKNL
jgi:hypothetical protein